MRVHQELCAGILRRRASFGAALAAALSGVALASCVWLAQGVRVQSVTPSEGVRIATPVKAHLRDGSTVVYTGGVSVSGGSLLGAGDRYNLTLTDSERIYALALDDVVGMESFQTEISGTRSVIVSALATTGVFLGSVALVNALFGSCPTVYSAEGTIEEAELFSSSIAPLFEARDLDRLAAQPDEEGVLTLEVRNEALETHYINNLQLLEVLHAPSEYVLPDASQRPVVVGDLRPVSGVTNRLGEDVSAVLAGSDGLAYSTPVELIETIRAHDLEDWMELSVAVPPGADQIGLVLRGRNSLLGTVLLYNVMLEPMGASALDWVGDDLGQISTAVELGRWFSERSGLRVSIWREGTYQEVARVPDTGPIAWHDVAVAIGVRPGETALRVRLSSIADHWRIDRLAVAGEIREAVGIAIAAGAVTDEDGEASSEALDRIADTDDAYLSTTPGQRFFVRFPVGRPTGGGARTFLLSSLGYYTEWIRTDWIRQDSGSVTDGFSPNDDALLEALDRWKGTREDFERRFREERVPVGGE